MGSFNVTGSYSNLPIRSGDECYVILCSCTGYNINIHLDVRFLSLPIKVYYDDYGCFYEDDIDDSGFYSQYLRNLFGKEINVIIDEFSRAMHDRTKSLAAHMPENEKPFLIVEHRFFIDQMAQMVDSDYNYGPPKYWDEDDMFCLDDEDGFTLYQKLRAVVSKFAICPGVSHYGGQFDNILPFKNLYQSVVDFLEKDGYRETDKWSD